MNSNDIFMITSVIRTGTIPWSYCSVRSAFSTEERFEQTLNTIQSIRDKAPGSTIILAEGSELSNEMEETIKHAVDHYIPCYKNKVIHDICTQNGMKGYGEAIKTMEVIHYINDKQLSFRRFFKISGRYYLNSAFSHENFSLEQFSFKLFNTTAGSTVLYSVPYLLFNEYKRTLQNIITIYETTGPQSYETLLPMMCEPKKLIEQLGVCGYIGVPNENGLKDFYES